MSAQSHPPDVAAKTALEAGHAEQIMFNHYREVVTREAAAKFWDIRPK